MFKIFITLLKITKYYYRLEFLYDLVFDKGDTTGALALMVLSPDTCKLENTSLLNTAKAPLFITTPFTPTIHVPIQFPTPQFTPTQYSTI